jgi:hypothetical protein
MNCIRGLGGGGVLHDVWKLYFPDLVWLHLYPTHFIFFGKFFFFQSTLTHVMNADLIQAKNTGELLRWYCIVHWFAFTLLKYIIPPSGRLWIMKLEIELCYQSYWVQCMVDQREPAGHRGARKINLAPDYRSWHPEFSGFCNKIASISY